MYTQNLSLFSKLFLDTKSVFYDVTTFLYYLLIYTDPAVLSPKPQVVGFFSKEKLSWDNNNLACILVFPPWQRRGFGQVLMGLSYLLSKRDGRLGGPEKPLSELGRRAYIHFWAGTISRYILAIPSKRTVTIKMISDATYITPEDIITTLREMEVLEHRKKAGAKAFINKIKVKEWAEKHHVELQDPVDREAFDRFVTWDDGDDEDPENGAEEGELNMEEDEND
jgi:MOZ/SAS family